MFYEAFFFGRRSILLQCPDVAARRILAAVSRGESSLILANKAIVGLVQKAGRDCQWAGNFMRVWQFLPLVAARSDES